MLCNLLLTVRLHGYLLEDAHDSGRGVCVLPGSHGREIISATVIQQVCHLNAWFYFNFQDIININSTDCFSMT